MKTKPDHPSQLSRNMPAETIDRTADEGATGPAAKANGESTIAIEIDQPAAISGTIAPVCRDSAPGQGW